MASDLSVEVVEISFRYCINPNCLNFKKPISATFDGRLWKIRVERESCQPSDFAVDPSAYFSIYVTIKPKLLPSESFNLIVLGPGFDPFNFKLESKIKDDEYGPFRIRISHILRFCKSHLYVLMLTLQRPCSVDKSSVTNKLEVLSSAKFLNFSAQLFKNEAMSDVIVRVQGKDLPAHKIVLCAASSVFKNMFESSFREACSNIVEIKDFDSEAVSEMLKFIYTHKAPAYENVKVTSLYKVTHKYDIEHLLELCRCELQSTINTENALDRLALSDKYNDVQLKRTALDFICENTPALSDVLKYQEIMRQRPQLLKDILECKFKQK